MVDAFTGAVVLANVEHHLHRPSKKYKVAISPPESGNVLGRFCDLLALSPNRCTLKLSPGQTAPVRDPRVLLPATRVDSVEEADVLAVFLKATAQKSELGTARLDPKEAALLANALPALTENVVRFAPESSCGAVVCSALESDNREVQLVVIDLGTAVAESRNPLEDLRHAWARSREALGGLVYIVEHAKRLEQDISLQVKTGGATARWRGRWYSERAEFTPGWTASLTIHR